ncbi:unnamed protein product [Moneuplotes crassus]|uniref:Uncharacterized protein n=1 Tax=Euplotes crassus TaxID=5936 RepID=A0AAD1TYZ1_EUPCR|nr:unnamed protein product [Moneuplotes crassus]
MPKRSMQEPVAICQFPVHPPISKLIHLPQLQNHCISSRSLNSAITTPDPVFLLLKVIKECWLEMELTTGTTCLPSIKQESTKVLSQLRTAVQAQQWESIHRLLTEAQMVEDILKNDADFREFAVEKVWRDCTRVVKKEKDRNSVLVEKEIRQRYEGLMVETVKQLGKQRVRVMERGQREVERREREFEQRVEEMREEEERRMEEERVVFQRKVEQFEEKLRKAEVEKIQINTENEQLKSKIVILEENLTDERKSMVELKASFDKEIQTLRNTQAIHLKELDESYSIKFANFRNGIKSKHLKIIKSHQTLQRSIKQKSEFISNLQKEAETTSKLSESLSEAHQRLSKQFNELIGQYTKEGFSALCESLKPTITWRRDLSGYVKFTEDDTDLFLRFDKEEHLKLIKSIKMRLPKLEILSIGITIPRDVDHLNQFLERYFPKRVASLTLHIDPTDHFESNNLVQNLLYICPNVMGKLFLWNLRIPQDRLVKLISVNKTKITLGLLKCKLMLDSVPVFEEDLVGSTLQTLNLSGCRSCFKENWEEDCSLFKNLIAGLSKCEDFKSNLHKIILHDYKLSREEVSQIILENGFEEVVIDK